MPSRPEVPPTRGKRLEAVRAALDVEQKDLARQLADIAADLVAREVIAGGWTWTPTRVSTLIAEKKPMTLDEAACVVVLAARRGLAEYDWDWLVLGTQATEVKRRRSEPRERRVG